MSTMLVNAGLTTFQKIEETNPRQIELVIIINMKYIMHSSDLFSRIRLKLCN